MLSHLLLGWMAGWWIARCSRPVEVRLRSRALQRLALARVMKFLRELQAPEFAARYARLLSLLVRWIAARMAKVGWQLSCLAAAYLLCEALRYGLAGGELPTASSVELVGMHVTVNELVFSLAVMIGAIARALAVRWRASSLEVKRVRAAVPSP